MTDLGLLGVRTLVTGQAGQLVGSGFFFFFFLVTDKVTRYLNLLS